MTTNNYPTERSLITKLQDEAMDKIHKIAREAKIDIVLICDEDIIGRLEDEPERLSQLTDTKISQMKDDIASELSEAFTFAVDNAIHNNLE